MTDKRDEALKLALEALTHFEKAGLATLKTVDAITAIREALTQPQEKYQYGTPLLDAMTGKTEQPAVKQDLTPEQPAQQQKEGFASPGGGYVPAIPRPMPLDWKLVPRKATPEMLKAMDECAQEGYDERLYAGMASSVDMAAWDASPVMGTLPEQPAQEQEPVLWQILNGVCHAGVRSTENLAKEAAAGMQKAHDLGGSLAAFHVRPLYTSPPASKPWVGLTKEDRYKAIRPLYRDDATAALAACHSNDEYEAIETKLREKNA